MYNTGSTNNIADNPAITNKAEQLAWKEQLFNKKENGWNFKTAEQKQEILEEFDISKRLELLYRILLEEIDILKIEKKISKKSKKMKNKKKRKMKKKTKKR